MTADHTARLRVTTTNEGTERRLSVGAEQYSIFNRDKGFSTPEGLHLHDPATSFERTGDRWTRVNTEHIGFDAYGCVPTSYNGSESLTSEYLVWDGPLRDGYMTPGTYRFEVPVTIYGPDGGFGDEPQAEFRWGFNLTVENPNT